MFTVCMAACCGPCAETCGLYFSKVLSKPEIFNPFYAKKYHLKCLIVSPYLVNGIENTCNCGSNQYPIWSKARYFLNYVGASPGESSVPTASGWRGGERHNDCLKSYNSHLFPLTWPPSLSYFPHSCLLPLVLEP